MQCVLECLQSAPWSLKGELLTGVVSFHPQAIEYGETYGLPPPDIGDEWI